MGGQLCGATPGGQLVMEQRACLSRPPSAKSCVDPADPADSCRRCAGTMRDRAQAARHALCPVSGVAGNPDASAAVARVGDAAAPAPPEHAALRPPGHAAALSIVCGQMCEAPTCCVGRRSGRCWWVGSTSRCALRRRGRVSGRRQRAGGRSHCERPHQGAAERKRRT